MHPYTVPDIRRILRETTCPTAAPPLDAARRTRHASPTDGTTHQLLLNALAGCGRPAPQPFPAVPVIQELPASDSQPPHAHPEGTWPETWMAVPSACPICDGPTVADHYLNSSRGPGWRCTADPSHYWQVRLTPLRRYLAANPPQLCYPWYGAREEERRAWLEAHRYPPRLSAVPLAIAAPG